MSCAKSAGFSLITFFIISILVVSCLQTNTKDSKPDKIGTTKQESTLSQITLEEFLKNSAYTDSLEYSGATPFVYYKTGYFLDKDKKTTLAISCQDDSTYIIKLYRIQNSKNQILDSVFGLEAGLISFNVIYDDYNFDGQTDFFIQVSASNGYSMSRGHLLTINPSTKKLEYHAEARNLANMRPDSKTISVISDELIFCKDNGLKDVCKKKNIWIEGHLKAESIDCPCEGYQ